MTATPWRSFWVAHRRGLLGSLIWLGMAVLTLVPTPLEPVARLYHALCTLFPALAIPGQVVPPLSLGLLLLLLGIIGLVGIATGLRELFATWRMMRLLRQCSAPLPPRLLVVARQQTLQDRLIFLATPTLVALCYGLLRPRIAISAGLMARLDDAELAAVLLHERHHLRRRDPLRYLLLHALTTGLFLVPLAPMVHRWLETRIELAADRAALAVLPRGALAGALAAVLTVPPDLPAGLAALTATETRIAHLAGMPQPAPAPVAASLMSVALLAVLALALVWLARPREVWEVICALCPGLA